MTAEAVRSAKRALRERIWDRLEREGWARPPRPVHGRIPNFAGAAAAAARLTQQPVWKGARVIKCNPDAPQRPVRRAALQAGKVVLMPTPRLRRGFLVLDPSAIPPTRLEEASSIAGAFRLGRPVDLAALPPPDLIVVGSVAVAPDGARVGKGEGYSELEYGILADRGVVDSRTPVVTTVHDVQVVDRIPVEPFDVPVDVIITPTRVIETATALARPRGILWEYVTDAMLAAMPVLREGRAARRPL
jgi:5-formyltetrahydrofolate cyclo-ligase